MRSHIKEISVPISPHNWPFGEGDAPATGEFPAQNPSNAEKFLFGDVFM